MPSVLISGANRGLGLEFARQYAADGWRVHATTRDLARADALSSIGGDVSVHQLDVTEKAGIDKLALELKSLPLDLLIANAGVIGPRGMTPEIVDRESWIETFMVNAIAPIALAGAFKANLLKGRQKKVVTISSRLASISENSSGGLYVYRSSKAALNAAWRSLAMDWMPSEIACVLVSPGWVRTDMGGAHADIEPSESVSGMRKVIEALTLKQTGQFLSHTGDQISW